jgi:hypothetical protein
MNLCSFGLVVRFAYDLLAVVAAVDAQWSTGKVEGQINRSRRSSVKCRDTPASSYSVRECCRTRPKHRWTVTMSGIKTAHEPKSC